MKKILWGIILVVFVSAIQICLADGDGWYKSLMDAADVDKTPPADGEGLIWDDTDNLWRAGDVGTVSDAAYGSAWNGTTTIAPSKNAVYDKIETLSGGTPGGANLSVQYNNSGSFGGVSIGTAGQYLKVNATATGYTWDTPGGSGNISGVGAADQISYFTGANAIAGNGNMTFNATTNLTTLYNLTLTVPLADGSVANDITLTNITQVTARSHTLLSDIGTNAHSVIDTFIASKAAASGLASLDASSLVVQNPASATATPTASKIPIADGSAKLDGWITLGAAVDISGETNLSGDTEIVLTGDALSIGATITRDTEWDTWAEHPALTAANIVLGNATNVPTVTAMSGDINITNAGVTAVQDNSVDGTDIALGSDAQGNVMFYDGTDWVKLAVGTSGQVLHSGGAAANVTWDTDDGAGGGAPTTADYLVGTADAGLSAEIVVGTTPGGELGGTWGTPTLDDSVTVTGWVMGASTATTPAADDNDTSLATTAYAQTELNAAGGRSISCASGSCDADPETYTDTKCIYFETPVATDDFKSIWYAKNAATITSIWAESDQTVTFMLQVDDGTPADVDTVDLAPAAGTAEDTSLNGDATMAAGDRLDLATTSVSGTPTWCSICWTFTRDD